MLPMKRDLQELIISKGECSQIAEQSFNSQFLENNNSKNKPSPLFSFLSSFGDILNSFLSSIFKSLDGEYLWQVSAFGCGLVFWALFIFIFCALFIFGAFASVITYLISNYKVVLIVVAIPLIEILRRKYLKKRKFVNLIKLLKEVDKHNQVVENLHTLDQLAAVGNPVKINDRGAVIEVLRITRESLVRALKTERILRENPKFRPELFNIDLNSLQAEKTTIKAIEYAELLDNAMQIGVSVQKEMQRLQTKR